MAVGRAGAVPKDSKSGIGRQVGLLDALTDEVTSLAIHHKRRRLRLCDGNRTQCREESEPADSYRPQAPTPNERVLKPARETHGVENYRALRMSYQAGGDHPLRGHVPQL